jgi:hypothetical protein
MLQQQLQTLPCQLSHRCSCCQAAWLVMLRWHQQPHQLRTAAGKALRVAGQHLPELLKDMGH